MTCVILAAGRGTRMGVLTDACPKPMLPICGKPKLAYTIEQLPKEITDVVIVVGYLKEQIVEYFGDTYAGRAITYVAQKELNGTGGAVTLVKEYVSEKFLVIMGDDLYLKSDLERLLKYDFSFLVHKIKDVKNFGFIEVDDRGHLHSVKESPHDKEGEGLVGTSGFVLSASFFDYDLVPKAPGSDEYGLPQTLVSVAQDHPVQIIEAKNWFAIGTPTDLKKAQKIITQYIAS